MSSKDVRNFTQRSQRNRRDAYVSWLEHAGDGARAWGTGGRQNEEESWVSALRTVGPEDASVILTVLLVPAGFYLAYLPRPPASLKLIAK